MKFLDYFEISLENLAKRKMRTFLTAIAIAIGMCFVMIFVSIAIGGEDFLLNSLSEFNDINMVTVTNQEYQSAEELSQKLALADNSEKSTDELFTPKKITKEVIDDLSKNDKVNEVILKYNDEVSELIFNDKLVKEQSIVSYVDKFYLDSELESLKKQNIKSIINEDISYLACGKMITDNDVNSVMITQDFASKTLECDDYESLIGQKITLKGVIPTSDKNKTTEAVATIVGIVDSRFYEPSVIVSKDIMEQMKNFNEGTDIKLADRGVDIMEISVKEIADVVTISEYIQYDLGYTVDSVQNVAKTLEKVFSIFRKVALLLSSFVTLIACLMVVNTMVMSVKERTKSIGIMKATGASRRDVRHLFMMESFTIGLIGGILSLVVSYFVMILAREIIAYFLITYLDVTNSTILILNQSITLNSIVAICTISIGIIITILAGLSSAIKASKLDPIEAIKHS